MLRRRVRLVPTALAVVLLVPSAWATPAGAAPKGSSGEVAFGGYYSGTVKLPAFSPDGKGGCLWGTKFDALNGMAAVGLYFGDVMISVHGKQHALQDFDLLVGLARFGDTETVQSTEARSTTGAEVSLGYNLDNQLDSAGVGISGTITSNSRGTAGSVRATLDVEKDFTLVGSQHITITGSWKGCTNVGAGTV